MTLLTVTLLSSASVLAIFKAILLALAVAWTIRDYSGNKKAFDKDTGLHDVVEAK